VHATGGLEPVVADRDGLVLQQAHELVLLDALLPDPPQDGEPLLQAQRRNANRERICGGDRGASRGGGSVGSRRGVHGGGGGGWREARRVSSASVGDDGLHVLDGLCDPKAFAAPLRTGPLPPTSGPKDLAGLHEFCPNSAPGLWFLKNYCT
jgi:hypothetical protein